MNGSTCLVCPIGQFQNSMGQAACVDCATGQYSDSDATIRCTLCRAGQHRPAGATKTKCLDCVKGQYQNKQGQLACLECSVGQYMNEEGQHKCIKCNYGTYAPKIGTKRTCDQCEDFKMPNAQASECTRPNWNIPSSCGSEEYLDDSEDDPTLHACVKCPFGASCTGSSTLDGRYGTVKNCTYNQDDELTGKQMWWCWWCVVDEIIEGGDDHGGVFCCLHGATRV